jgi:2-polyprenyl-3-methyl-5-hydroxy-6-metoxy-1,4-benzoquinol methylase
MTFVDRLLQRRRIAVARNHIPVFGHVLDVGCADGALFRMLRDRNVSGIGIDHDLHKTRRFNGFTLIPGSFPDDVPVGPMFDAITMLAVVEHVPENELTRWPHECLSRLRMGGRLIVTVPAAAADRLLIPLQKLGLIHGMSLETHHGFSPARVPEIFSVDGLKPVARRRFEFGFNNLFVFGKE